MSSPSPHTAVVFAYHDVGVRCLKVLLARGVTVPLVVTHEDDPSENIWFESVASLCKERGIPHIAPPDAKSAELLERVASLRPGWIFSFYYRHLLPPGLLRQARHGAFNMHGSLLPKYRGRVPVNWAVLRGEAETGATLHEMVARPDAGFIVAQVSVPILPDDTAHAVFAKVATAAEKALWDVLPEMLAGNTPRRPNDVGRGSYFGGRKPDDGRVDWSRPAREVYNLYRAVAPPYPGAFVELRGRRFVIARARLPPPGNRQGPDLSPGLHVVAGGEIVAVCGDGGVVVVQQLLESGREVAPDALREVLDDEERDGAAAAAAARPKRILILGVNGFIGHHLARRILETTDWHVRGLDLGSHRIASLAEQHGGGSGCRFVFRQGNMASNGRWIEDQVAACDVVVPLAAIATPRTYVEDPLSVFELDFEAHLAIVRWATQHGTRLVFPSTSEVYGLCRDAELSPSGSELAYGPVCKTRWIYACSKQLMDRVVWAHGTQRGLDFTLFRPFNWVGAGLDSLAPRPAGGSRVTTQFLGNLLRGEDLTLSDGGRQRRAFTAVGDGVDALVRILADDAGVTRGRIYNIGSPDNDCSVRELAGRILKAARGTPELAGRCAGVKMVEVPSGELYGDGYQDVLRRVPCITDTCRDLGWKPTMSLDDCVRAMVDAVVPFADVAAQGGELVW
ncbi:hypothetical protein RB598_003001 [Gaeumannomyces tritici]